MTPDELLAKARRALASAEVPAERGDPEGACNRAYYAMFDAVRAGLLSLGADARPGKSHSSRTHGGFWRRSKPDWWTWVGMLADP